jgi:homoserine kinase type II
MPAMAVLTRVTLAEARAFAAAYELGEVTGIEGIPAGSVNSNYRVEAAQPVFLRVYEEQDFSGAVREAATLELLSAGGVPTPSPFVTRDGGRIGTLAGKPAALFPWRDGQMRCQRAVSAADARRVGEALARVHVAGAGLEAPPGRFEAPQLDERLDRIAGARSPELAAQAAPLRAKLAAWWARRDPALPRGLIHGDLFRDNVLWDARGEISALLDFESASHGVLAYDLAVTFLAWCFGDGLDVALARAMIDGYGAVRPLAPAERSGLRAEACAAAIRFTITRITDYAMRETDAPRVIKDWRRFARRLEAVETSALFDA